MPKLHLQLKREPPLGLLTQTDRRPPYEFYTNSHLCRSLPDICSVDIYSSLEYLGCRDHETMIMEIAHRAIFTILINTLTSARDT